MNRISVILFTLLLFTYGLQAQTLDEAKKMYLEGRYAESKPVFEKYVTSSPNNASYNQWYGTCLLETGELDKAQKHLEFAASKKVVGAHLSLGKLYFLQYRFDDSLESYETYEKMVQKDKKLQADAESVEVRIAQSKNAARMLEHCENIQIIDSSVVDKDGFLKYYQLSEESGTLQYEDNSERTVVYENQLKDRRYYASPNADNYYRLYSQTKLFEDWSEKAQLNLPADSAENDNYPYVLSDGVTVYYASTGNESIGGYDLFVSRYNMDSDTYLAPEQLGMPFNSIYNDYMMAIDEYNGIGYFATDRYQSEGKVIIYTFIPNEEKDIIENDDPDYISSRAQIKSIKDSWKPGAKYAAMLEGIRQNNAKASQQVKKDFDFVINDNIVYHTMDEFEDEAAKTLFMQSQSVKQQIETLENELEMQRQDYTKGNSSKKESLKSSILGNESRLVKLYDDYDELVVKVRNSEIKFLKQQ